MGEFKNHKMSFTPQYFEIREVGKRIKS